MGFTGVNHTRPGEETSAPREIWGGRISSEFGTHIVRR